VSYKEGEFDIYCEKKIIVTKAQEKLRKMVKRVEGKIEKREKRAQYCSVEGGGEKEREKEAESGEESEWKRFYL